MQPRKIEFRILKDKAFKVLIVLLAFLSILPLMLILFYIIRQGLGALNLNFLVEIPTPVGEKGGGIANALAGTFFLVIIAGIPSIPLGIAAGIFLSEHQQSKIAFWTRLAIDVLQGTPSIVIGIIAYLWLVVPMGGFSAFSGGMALSIMMLPMIITSTEETLKLIPFSLKEAALALGVPYYRIILKIVVPAGLSGIMTGILIGLARIAGETAPLLFTAFGNAFMNWNILKPVNAMPLLIFNYATSPYPEWHRIAWGAAFVLVGLVLTLNLIVRVIAKRWKVRF